MTGGGFALLDQNDSSNAGHFSGHAFIRGPSFLHLPIITICLLGVQIFWSVEMSYASPYLLALGISKSHMAIVFIAGPLSGLVMQPLIGVMADSCTSRWGRRRPYMFSGTVLCSIAMLLLGWTKEVAGWFTSNPTTLTLWLAVLSIFLIDFSINAVMAVDRALVVDTLPASMQSAGTAWAARMGGVGAVVGFFVGNLNLPSLLPILGSSELQIISILASLILLGTQLVTAGMVNERVLLKGPSGPGGSSSKSFTQELKEIFTNLFNLPRTIRQICIIQFFAWISWFPILFYTTVYVGDLNRRAFYDPLKSQNTQNITRTFLTRAFHQFSSLVLRDTIDDIEEESTRLGSRALFYSSVLSLLVTIGVPFFVTEASSSSRRRKRERLHPRQARHVNGGVMGGGRGSAGSVDDYEMSPGSSRTPRGLGRFTSGNGLLGRLRELSIPESIKVHIASLWAASHAIVAVCMMGTFFTYSVAGATFLIIVTGFSWAVTSWAPFALLAEAILTEPADSMSGGAGDRSSILLTDTRTRLSTSHRRSTSGGPGHENGNRNIGGSGGAGVNVREDSQIFVPGHSSDSESDVESEDGESARKEGAERRKKFLTLGSTAGVSKVDLRPEIRMFGDDYGDGDGEGAGDEEADEEATLVGNRRTRDRDRDEEEGSVDEEEDLGANHNGGGLSAKAGIILGISNIFIVIPQFIVTGISSVIFAIFDPDKTIVHRKSRDVSEDEIPKFSNSVAYIFRLGGVSAFIAFILCWRLARELRHR